MQAHSSHPTADRTDLAHLYATWILVAIAGFVIGSAILTVAAANAPQSAGGMQLVLKTVTAL